MVAVARSARDNGAMNPRPLLLLSLALALATAAGADSPLTSIDLASAYADLPAVRIARETHRADGEVVQFLLGNAPTDQKAAVVNALGWGKGHHNGRLFVEGLRAARGVRQEDLTLSYLSAADRFVLGYLLALDDYLELRPLEPQGRDLWGATPMQLLDQAAVALPGDFAVQYVRGLVVAQKAMGESFCSAYLATQHVIDAFPVKKRNLRPAALSAAQQYMQLYQKDCGPGPAKPKAANPELNQIYAVTRFSDFVVTGTQAGVVVWRPDSQKPVAVRDEFICQHLLVWGNAVWAGCGGRVLRWDGHDWRSYLVETKQDAKYHHPLRGARGELLVVRGGRAWRYDAAGDAFLPIPLGLTGDPYDVIVRRDGEVLWIDFLRGLRGSGGESWALRSERYPGRNPRSFREDALGRLWVLDFESGAFRLDPATGAFVRESGLDDKASGVAVDEKHGRTLLLHYTRGLVVKEGDGSTRLIDLGDLRYLRDLFLDESGDVWVAGWTGLVRLHQAGGEWKRESWRVE